MKRLTKRQQRLLVRIWQATGPELERIRRAELRGLPYNWKDVEALLELGDLYDGPPRQTSGLVEMQRLFVRAARRQGLLPTVVRETAAARSIPETADRPPRRVKRAAAGSGRPLTR